MATATIADRGAFPELTDPQIDALRPYGTERDVVAGESLFRSGDRSYDFVVVLAGRVDIVTDRGTRHERVVVEHGPRRFVGEISLISGQAAYLDAVVTEDGRVLAISPRRLRDVLDEDPVLSELILRAFLLRRDRLRQQQVGLHLVGSRFSADTRRLLEFLARSRIPYVWHDVEIDREAEALLCAAAIRPEETPVVLRQGGETLRNPSNAELAGAIGVKSSGGAGADLYDLAVVGAGPAGLAAAVYGASEGLQTVALDAVALGGQAGTSTRIENYLGFPAGLSGDELTVRAAIQARKFGARLIVPCEVVGVREEGGGVHVLELADGDEVAARAVIVATGAQYRRLPLERLEDFEGFGVFYAATIAEQQRCAGSSVAVVGGGNSAGQAAAWLAERSEVVHVLIRRDGLGATMSRYLVDELARRPNVVLHPRTEVRALHGGRALEAISVGAAGGGPPDARLDVSGLFVFIGADPHTAWLRGHVALDEHGFVLTGADLPEDGAPPLVSSRPGILAVGDARHGSIKRCASAVGEGSMAVRLVHEHLAALV